MSPGCARLSAQSTALSNSCDQQANAQDKAHGTVDRPPGLASHEAAWEDVDSLKEPDASRDNEKQTRNRESDSQATISGMPEYRSSGDPFP